MYIRSGKFYLTFKKFKNIPYDEEGDIKNPTFGAGIRFEGYGFDFGYTAGPDTHPRTNSLFFSISAEI